MSKHQDGLQFYLEARHRENTKAGVGLESKKVRDMQSVRGWFFVNEPRKLLFLIV